MDTAKLAKYTGIVILMIITIPIAGFIWIPMLLFGWKYVKLAIKVDLIVIYLLFRLPIWLFIQLPLYSLKFGSGKLSKFFHRGIRSMRNRRKLTILLILLFGFIVSSLFPVSFSSPNLFSIYFWVGQWQNLFFVTVGTVTMTMIVLTIYEAISGGIAQKEMPGEWAREEFKKAPEESVRRSQESAERAQRGYEKGKDAAEGVYRNIKNTETSDFHPGSFVSGDMIGELSSLGDMLGINTDEMDLGTASLVFLVAFAFFWLQLLIVLFFAISYVQLIAPIVLGPLAGALGLGGDYANWIGNTVGDKYLAGIQVDISDEFQMVEQARQRVYCLLKGPSCLRQWQLNNTRQPGSEAVGESYGLKIDRFEVGSGSQIDVAFKNGDYTLPISFGLSNNRHGLKGINARNVSYRIKIIDFDRGRNNPFCQTGWEPINGYNISGWEDLSEDRREDGWGSNDLYPGTSASTGFLTLEDLNLSGCEMLQPALGEYKTVLLQVRYDYSSQATLYFEAMSRQTLQANPDVSRQWKKSETADTPVKSALNVNSPVIFDEEALNSPNPDVESARPFSMRASLTTGNSDLEYKINDLKVRKSEEVQVVDEGAGSGGMTCQFEESGEILEPDPDEVDIISGGEYGGERWFSASNSPPFFGCRMELSNPRQINPSGQTLTMDVESNYTVRLNEKMDRFKVFNSRCSVFNCPLLVTRYQAEFADHEGDTRYPYSYKCEGVDAGNGCEVVRAGRSDWSKIQLMTGGQGDDQISSRRVDSKLERGEIALNPAQTSDEVIPYSVNDFRKRLNDPNYFLSKEGEMETVENYGPEIEKFEKLAIGLRETQVNRMEDIASSGSRGFAIVSRVIDGEREIEFRELSYQICEDSYNSKFSTKKEAYAAYFMRNFMDPSGGDVLVAVKGDYVSSGESGKCRSVKSSSSSGSG